MQLSCLCLVTSRFTCTGEEEQLKDRFGNVIYDVTSSELEDKSRYPNYTKHSDRRLEIIQEQGQIIFVPSGWYHQVYNLVRFLNETLKIFTVRKFF